MIRHRRRAKPFLLFGSVIILLSVCPSWQKPAPKPCASSVKGFRFAQVNTNGAPLTARTARRGATARKGICFLLHRSALCWEAGKQKTNSSKGADMKYAIERRPLFPLGKLVANTRRVGCFAEGRTFTCRISLAACARTVARIPAPERLPNEGQRNDLGAYGVGPLGDDLAFAQ